MNQQIVIKQTLLLLSALRLSQQWTLKFQYFMVWWS